MEATDKTAPEHRAVIRTARYVYVEAEAQVLDVEAISPRAEAETGLGCMDKEEHIVPAALEQGNHQSLEEGDPLIEYTPGLQSYLEGIDKDGGVALCNTLCDQTTAGCTLSDVPGREDFVLEWLATCSQLSADGPLQHSLEAVKDFIQAFDRYSATNGDSGSSNLWGESRRKRFEEETRFATGGVVLRGTSWHPFES